MQSPLNESDSAHQRDLLLRTHRGEEPAARELWSRCAPRMIAVAGLYTSRVGGDSAARDVVQGVFCRVLDTPRAELERVADPLGYLIAAVRNAAMNLARGERRHNMAAERASDARRDEPERDQNSAPDNVADQCEGSVLLNAAMRGLSPEQREVILLKHTAGLTFEQIALALGIPRSTASTRYQAAIVRLRESMSDAASGITSSQPRLAMEVSP